MAPKKYGRDGVRLMFSFRLVLRLPGTLYEVWCLSVIAGNVLQWPVLHPGTPPLMTFPFHSNGHWESPIQSSANTTFKAPPTLSSLLGNKVCRALDGGDSVSVGLDRKTCAGAAWPGTQLRQGEKICSLVFFCCLTARRWSSLWVTSCKHDVYFLLFRFRMINHVDDELVRWVKCDVLQHCV